MTRAMQPQPSDDADHQGNKPRALVLGAYGMLGHKLAQGLRPTHQVYGSIRQPSANPTYEAALAGVRLLPGVDAEDLPSVADAITRVRPAVIVNCIGLVKQKITSDFLRAVELNGAFPHRLADLARASGARLLHFSTDCVFSGREGNYSETHAADARDLYGLTKFLGETRGEGTLTLRTSILGHELGTRCGLLEWFLDQKGGAIAGYDAAVFSGLTTVAIASLVRTLLLEHPLLEGLWHVSAEPITKYALLNIVKSTYAADVQIDRDRDFVIDRSLDSRAFRKATGWSPDPWSQMIADLRRDYLLNEAYLEKNTTPGMLTP